jgi:hypothetical protein
MEPAEDQGLLPPNYEARTKDELIPHLRRVGVETSSACLKKVILAQWTLFVVLKQRYSPEWAEWIEFGAELWGVAMKYGNEELHKRLQSYGLPPCHQIKREKVAYALRSLIWSKPGGMPRAASGTVPMSSQANARAGEADPRDAIIAKLTARCDLLQSDNGRISTELVRAELKVEDVELRYKMSQDRLAGMQRTIDYKDQQIAEVEREKEAVTVDIIKERAEKSALQGQVSKLREKLSISEAKVKLLATNFKGLREEKGHSEQQNARLRQEIAHLEEEYRRISSLKDREVQAKAQAQSEVAVLGEQHKADRVIGSSTNFNPRLKVLNSRLHGNRSALKLRRRTLLSTASCCPM